MKKVVKVAVVAVGLFLAGSTVNAQQKFAHINSAELLQLMPEVKVADATFQTFQKQKQTALELMNTEREKKIATYQEKNKTISEANKLTVGKELETMGAEIQDFTKRMEETQQKAQQELSAKQAELYQPIYLKAETAVKAVSKEKGYAYVFDVSQPGVVYFDGGDDIIALVKTKLGITATTAATPKK
ncbi:OmpH family outer membrane protein [Arcticibacter eurypsychrophilus]|uniref:OmpH family outer membrane protein n=1 Tax=Arcticibacter eurypsychrophilus TaxID=1434752 RepID=UPI00084D87CC|nr:OmpH family outer membrane protein [Arcticibacter eurypsychrophilus]